MKNKVTSFSLKHPISILMMLFAFVIVSLISCFVIKIDYLPTLSERYILVTTKFTGISAKEMEKLVTIPVEDSFSSLKGIKNISSVTRDGISITQLELQWGNDIDIALTETRELIDSCFTILPTGCEKPNAQIYTPSTNDTIKLSIEPKDGDLKYCRYIVDNEIKQRFQRLDGVGTVSVTGGEKDEIHVILDKARLEGKKLTLQSVAESLATSNFEYPAGTLKEGNKDILLKTNGLYTSLQDIEETPIYFNDLGLIKIKDIGKVEYAIQDKSSFFINNGKEAVAIGIQKKGDASPLTVSQNVNNEIKRLEDTYGKYYDFNIISDSSVEIKDSIFQLIQSALIGVLIAFIVLIFFFKSFKVSTIISSIIPLCLLCSVVCLLLTGKTINLLSLAGITVGIGMVIDNSTVVFENIQQKVATYSDIPLIDNIQKATEEVTLSAFGSSFTTIIVFVPFFFLQGLLGELFVDLAVAVIASIAMGTILSITYVPAATYLSYKNKPNKIASSTKLQKSINRYSKKLTRVFKLLFIVPLLIIICIGVGLIFFKGLDKELLPKVSSNKINVEVYFENGTPLENIQRNAEYLITAMNGHSEVEQIYIEGGVDEDNYVLLSNPSIQKERIQLTIQSTNVEQTKSDVAQILDDTNVDYRFIENQNLLSQVLALNQDSHILTSEKSDDLNEKAFSLVQDKQQIVPYLVVTEQVFTPDRIACSRFNITARYTAKIARDALDGVQSSNFYDKGRRIPIIVKYPESLITNIKELENANLTIEESIVPLRAFGEFTEEISEKILYRYNRKPAKILNGEIDTSIEDSSIISLQEEQFGEMFRNTLILLIVILILLYCVMGAQFESFSMPILTMLALPPSFAGAFIFLKIFGQTININSVIALVVLFGTSINNAIILYEACLELKTVTKETVISACASKIRAITITTATTIFALIPFAIDPFHRNAQSSMPIAIIGGLLLSTAIVIYVIPPIMYYFFRKKRR